VGFGIGQAFPVVVEGLRTPKGGLFVVQEPEIHLHPDAQLAMADFLVELVRRGKRVIVETHSENILLRLRHAVIGAAKLKHDQVSILYVEGEKGGTSSVRPLSLNDLGEVANWPSGFMEEATDERLAIMEKIAKLKEGGR